VPKKPVKNVKERCKRHEAVCKRNRAGDKKEPDQNKKSSPKRNEKKGFLKGIFKKKIRTE
jgi:hypothetical protein